MALKGKIEDFGLTDVLQLIVRRGKSGMITLSNAADEVNAAIDNGAIVAVENTGRPTESSELASRLARAGVITSAQLGTVLKRRAETGEQMAVVLIAERCATPATLRPFTTARLSFRLPPTCEFGWIRPSPGFAMSVNCSVLPSVSGMYSSAIVGARNPRPALPRNNTASIGFHATLTLPVTGLLSDLRSS